MMDSKLLFSGMGCLDCKGFKQLLDTQSLVDCTLACDGGKISAHKLVLSACSSYLAKILLDHPVEHPIIILPELNIEDVKTLVHYMYTGELLRSDTINSISLLRTAAILSINSLNDLMLASSSSSPNSLLSSHNHQFSSASNSNNNNNNNNPPNTNNNNNIRPTATPQHPPQQQQHLDHRNSSIVDQISPLLAAISQQQHQQKLHALGAAGLDTSNGLAAAFALNQNENMVRNLAAAGHHHNYHDGATAAAASLNSILDAAAAAVASVNGASSLGDCNASGNSSSVAVAQFYSNLANGVRSTSPIAGATLNGSTPLTSSSSSDLSPSPLSNKSATNGVGVGSGDAGGGGGISFNLAEPFSYSSAITGIVPVTTNITTNNSTGAQSSITTNEFHFKCPVCQNHFQTICSFEYHMQRAHSVTSFGCEICHKPFASLRYVLTDHMRRCHGWKSSAINANAQQQQQPQPQPQQHNSNNNKNMEQEHQKFHC